MRSFKELKEELLIKAKAVPACKDEYKRAYESETEEELLKVIYDNIAWCSEKGVISNEWLSGFSAKALLESGVANTGLENTGFANSGNRNSGNWNSGNRNSGDRNSGNWNSGNRNSGNRNSGNRNSGNWNSGNWNSGNRNSGDSNSGYRNSGNWNSGNRNSGDSNSGYRNSGAFCTNQNPKAVLFDIETDITVKEWEQTRACYLMDNLLNPNMWIWSNEMTEEEKKNNPSHETTGGYLKNIGLKQAWKDMWPQLNDDDKEEFTSLPNFDAAKFEEITGIKID